MSSYAAAYDAWHSASYVAENTWCYVYQHTVSSCTRARCHQLFCAVLYATRVLQSHGMSVSTLQQVFRAVVTSKLIYTSPAWWDFTRSTDRQRIDAVLRRANKSGFWTSDARICAQQPMTNFLLKLLHFRTTHYMFSPTTIHRITTIRPQTSFTLLSAPWTRLSDCNFLTRMKNCY